MCLSCGAGFLGWVGHLLVVCNGAVHWFGLVSPPLLIPGSEHQCAFFLGLNSCMNIVLFVPC